MKKLALIAAGLALVVVGCGPINQPQYQAACLDANGNQVNQSYCGDQIEDDDDDDWDFRKRKKTKVYGSKSSFKPSRSWSSSRRRK